jgi:hypothetical protein
VTAAIWLTVPNTAEALDTGAAVGIGLGSFALGTALGAASNPYYGGYYGGYGYPYGYYPAAPAYYPPPAPYYGRGAAGTHITAAITRADFTRHDALMPASVLLPGLRLPP